MKITEEGIKFLNDNRATRTKIAVKMDVHPATVDNWVFQNNVRLTAVDVLVILSEDSGKTIADLITDDRR